MKKIATLIAALAVVITGVVYAQNVQQIELDVSQRVKVYTGGLLIGPTSLLTTNASINANRITRSLGTSATIDVASTGTLACSDSAAITLVGAKVGDPCFVGLPATQPTNGSGTFLCVATAADQIKLRFCNPSAGALDPSSATFYFRVLSSQ